MPSGANLQSIGVYLSRPGAFWKTGESQAKAPEGLWASFQAHVDQQVTSGRHSVAPPLNPTGLHVESSQSGAIRHTP